MKPSVLRMDYICLSCWPSGCHGNPSQPGYCQGYCLLSTNWQEGPTAEDNTYTTHWTQSSEASSSLELTTTASAFLSLSYLYLRLSDTILANSLSPWHQFCLVLVISSAPSLLVSSFLLWICQIVDVSCYNCTHLISVFCSFPHSHYFLYRLPLVSIQLYLSLDILSTCTGADNIAWLCKLFPPLAFMFLWFLDPSLVLCSYHMLSSPCSSHCLTDSLSPHPRVNALSVFS